MGQDWVPPSQPRAGQHAGGCWASAALGRPGPTSLRPSSCPLEDSPAPRPQGVPAGPVVTGRTSLTHFPTFTR